MAKHSLKVDNSDLENGEYIIWLNKEPLLQKA
jgi:hypothetical protein